MSFLDNKDSFSTWPPALSSLILLNTRDGDHGLSRGFSRGLAAFNESELAGVSWGDYCFFQLLSNQSVRGTFKQGH